MILNIFLIALSIFLLVISFTLLFVIKGKINDKKEKEQLKIGKTYQNFAENNPEAMANLKKLTATIVSCGHSLRDMEIKFRSTYKTK